MNQQIQIIGVYKVNYENVDGEDGFDEGESPENWIIAYLIEMFVKGAAKFDISSITQEQDYDSSYWQAAYDEHFLNEDGTDIIEEQVAEKSADVRLAFFLHCVDFDKPLKTSFGDVALPEPLPQFPERLNSKIRYLEE
jgi:hypothetical protein